MNLLSRVRCSCFFFIFFLFLSFLLREFLNSNLRNNKYGLFAKLTEVFEGSANHSLIFLGSSRAESHIVPEIFDSITSLNSFNIGLAGCNHSLSFGILKAYLSRHNPPKYLIMNLDYHRANEVTDTLFDFPRFFPYLDNIPLFSELCRRDKRFLFFPYLPFYQLPFYGENYLTHALNGLLKLDSPYYKHCIKGFIPIQDIEFKSIDLNPNKTYHIKVRKENLDYLDSIIFLCVKKNITPQFVFTPVYYQANLKIRNYHEVKKIFIDRLRMHNIVYYDYSQDSVLSQNIDFYAYDEYHLKRYGAELLTRKLACDFSSNN